MRRVTAYKEYTTREGDTFDALALDMYGDEKLAHYIIDFNPDHADVVIFGANVALRLPIVEGQIDQAMRSEDTRLNSSHIATSRMPSSA